MLADSGVAEYAGLPPGGSTRYTPQSVPVYGTIKAIQTYVPVFTAGSDPLPILTADLHSIRPPDRVGSGGLEG